MIGRDIYKINFSVYSSEKCEISELRIGVIGPSVVHIYAYFVRRTCIISQFNSESGKTILMMEKKFLTNEYFTYIVYTFEFNIDSLPFGNRAYIKVFLIKTTSSVEVITTILPIDVVPGVRETYNKRT